MAVQRVETERAGQMGDDGCRRGLHASGDVGDRRVGRGDHQQIDPARCAHHVVGAANRSLDPPPDGQQGTAEGEAGPTRADDA